MKLEFNNGYSTKWLFLSTISRSNLNLECWYFWREEIWRKTLRARMRTNNKLNPQVTQRSGIKPRPQWWEASTLSAAVLSLQVILVVILVIFSENTYLDKVLPFWACKQKLQSISVAENKTWLKEKFII